MPETKKQAEMWNCNYWLSRIVDCIHDAGSSDARYPNSGFIESCQTIYGIYLAHRDELSEME